MKLAASNIAWGSRDFERFLALLKHLGCDGVEVAPSLIWEEPIKSTGRERALIRNTTSAAGLTLVGLHSLYYTRPDLLLLGDRTSRMRLSDYTKELMSLCAELGGSTLVFGSPKNRRRGEMLMAEAVDTACDFFAAVSETAEKCGVFLCIEPLGAEESDFINSSEQAMTIVYRVNHPHICLHADAKAIISSHEDYQRTLREYSPYLKHFHVGDPGLAPPGSTGADHSGLGSALRASGYYGFVSIEMRSDFGAPETVIEHSIKYVRECYFGRRGTVMASEQAT